MPNIDGVLNGVLKLVLAAAVIAGAALATVTLLDRMALEDRVAARRALLVRSAELDRSAIAPSSPLACLDAGAGETVQNACEKAVFADAQSVASAVAYTGARLSLLKDAYDLAQHGDPDAVAAFAGTRRAVELDRYGFAAHVLTQRDGCTVERCPAFAMLGDTNALKSNMKARVFDAYVDRYAGAWDNIPAAPERPMAEATPPTAVLPSTVPPPAAPAMPTVPLASAVPPPSPGATGRPVDSRWDFPSSDSIPPVSIMNAEPKLPAGAAAARAAQPGATAEEAESAPPAAVPLPPSRPQAQAVTPPPMPPAR